MPDLSSSQNTIRLDGYQFQTFISTPAETEVFSALVNQSVFSYPLQTLTIDTNVGSTSDVLEDMEVVVFDQSTTTQKGRLRIASGGTTSTVMQINEVSAGRISIANNDKLSVRRSWRVRDRLVGATSSFPKDSRIAYSDQGSNPQPVCNSGGHWVGELDAGQTYATVQFTGSTSFNVDPDSGATVTHAWNFGDGTPATSTSADPSVTFPVGERWISHTATDSSNSETTTQYLWVKVYDPAGTRPTDCVIEDMSGSRSEGGWRVRVTVPAGWTQAQAPDGALIVIWERETYNAAVQSFGAATTGRSHIKFVGYLVADTVSHDYEAGTVSFDAINPVLLLARLPGFSQVLKIATSPANWRQIKGLTTNRAVIYLLRWGTTLLRTHDLILGGNNYNYPAFYEQAQTPDEQVRDIINGVGGEFICDRRGRVAVQHSLPLATSAQRTAATTTVTLTSTDLVDYEFERQHRYDSNTIQGRGFVAATTTAASRPLLSIAPGKAPSEAPSSGSFEKQIISTQTELNERTGRYYAHQNATYNGLPTSRGSITLHGSYDVFDLYAEWLKLTLASTYNKRGLSWSAARFVVTAISVSYDADSGSKRVALTVEEETDGAAGVTKNAPAAANNRLPAITIPRIEFPYFVPTSPILASVGTLAVMGNNGSVYISSDTNAYSPTYTAYALGLTGTPIGFQENPFSAKRLTGSGAVDAWVLTTTNVYYVADIFGARTVTNQLAFGYSTGLRTLHASTLISGHAVAATNRRSGGGVVVHYTVDGGTTWSSEIVVSSDYNTAAGSGVLRGDEGTPCVFISEHISGRAYVGAYTATGSGQTATVALYQSSDYGATWAPTSKITGAAQWPLRGLYIPYVGNNLDSIVYYANCDTATTVVQMRRNADGTQSTIDPISGSNKGAACGPNFTIRASPVNRLNMVMTAQRTNGSIYAYTPYITRDGGDTWTAIAAEIGTGGDYMEFFNFSRNTAEMFYACCNDGTVYRSSDLGTTLYNIRGDLPSIRLLGVIEN